VFEVGVPPVFRLTFLKDGTPVLPEAAGITIETVRPGGPRQTFAFVQKEGFLESTSEIPEPHRFDLTLRLIQHGHTHKYPAQFREGEHDDSHNHGHHHQHASFSTGSDFQDAHELAHAADIQKRFADRQVTTGQIVIFGLTGGLLPCPAAFTVLLICLQLKQFTLGFALVGAFSFGLALTMVTVGVAAAWSVGHAQRKWQGFNELMRRAPYVSTILLLLLASYMAWQGWKGLTVHG
jgi:nickel/cobalt exporter